MSDRARCKVVIVEDEGLIAADLKHRLERAGYEVASVAESGQQALQVIAEASPDLVLMDIRLRGELDGIQVAERVRRQFDLPVVYLTAYEDKQTLARVRQSEAFGYIRKPVASSSLRGTIEIALSKHRHEQRLREQVDWLRASFAAVPDAVAVTDGWGRITYLNDRAQEMAGCSADQALGQPYGEFLRFRYELSGWPTEELPLVEDFVPAAMLEGAPITLPQNICLAGAERNHAVEGTVSPRWNEGRLEGTVIVFRDIGPRRFAGRRKLEENKQEALVRLAAAVGSRLDLEIGVVADESASLLQKLPAESPLRAQAEQLEMAALDAFSVVSRLESFAQPPRVQMQQVRINDVLSSLGQSWKKRIPGLALLLGATPTVKADVYQLRRALSLIVKHAMDSMKPGASLVIETSANELAGMGAWVHARIAYAAFGEDARMLERAFEPCWTVPREGLPTAYALIKEMEGFLNANMEGGTVTWNVYLRPSASWANGALCRPGALLIEPNPRIGSVLQQHFSQHGLELLCVSCCQEAQVAADVHAGGWSLVIAHVPAEDAEREKLEAELARLQPGAAVRWLAGYCEQSPVDDAASSGWRFLTKWDLLGWARNAVAAQPEAKALAGGSRNGAAGG